MASRNVKTGTSIQGAGSSFDPADKLQSNTLKRHPKMDLNKSDLLRLLSYLEGELQGRDIVIATLKAEKAKQLLYQAKYGRFGLGDPFMALQRDSDNLKDNTFDEMAIKSMYDNQLAQLENLIATQRKAQMKMREQLAVGEKKYHKACSELDDEKRKHAQDTAQGDDVTYMLEKERERLKQEIDFEKAQNKKTEKELKKCLASVEEEKANAAKHKQVALLLIKERKKLIEKILQERQKCSQMEVILTDEKGKTKNMAEGLVQESTKSLKMEAAMEKQLNEFDVEREQLKNRLGKEESKNHELQAQVESLQQQVEYLKKHPTKAPQRDYLQSIEIQSSASPLKQISKDRNVDKVQSGSVPAISSAKQTNISRPADIADQTRHTTRENATMSPVKLYATSPASPEKLVSSFATVVQRDGRVSPTYYSQIDRNVNEQPLPISRSSGTSTNTAVITSGGGKISLQVSQSVSSPRKQIPVGRSAPPPVPPNKPNLSSSPVPGQKPTPPPKVGITISKDKITVSSSDNLAAEGSAGRSPRAIQIPVSVVNSPSSSSGSRTPSRDSSPMRKTQVCVNAK